MARKTEFLLFRWLSPHHLVVAMVTSALLAFICAYVISVVMHLVNALFPAISTAGAEPPASCVFAIFLNLAAIYGIMCIYIRHGCLETSLLGDSYNHHVLNDVAMFLGLLSCLGIMIVACFQSTKALIPHLIGATMAFLLGSIYCGMQTYLSYISSGVMNRKTKLRFVLSCCASSGFLLTYVFATIANRQGKVRDKLHWNSKDPGFSTHLGSTFCEWIMALCLISFFLTYYHEFKEIDYKVHIKNKETTSQQEEVTM